MSHEDGQPGLNAAIARAKRQRDQWKAQAEHMRRPRPTLVAAELMALAENTRALSIYELEALDAAWHAMFGELLILKNNEIVPATRASEPAGAVPEMADDTIIHLPEVLRKVGVSPSELSRRRRDGRFPPAIKLNGKTRIGWKGDSACMVTRAANAARFSAIGSVRL
jgi:predicted DNA-binding transcriptional regulator AlpA